LQPRTKLLSAYGEPIEIHGAVRIYMARRENTLNPNFGFIPSI